MKPFRSIFGNMVESLQDGGDVAVGSKVCSIVDGTVKMGRTGHELVVAAAGHRCLNARIEVRISCLLEKHLTI